MKTVDVSKMNVDDVLNIEKVVKYYYDEIVNREVAFTGYNNETKTIMRVAIEYVHHARTGSYNCVPDIIFE